MADAKTLAELADASGIPARTIRFYIARGLLTGPVKAGRGAAYTADHLARLEQIKALQSEGRMLSEIAQLVGGGSPEQVAAPAAAWWQYAMADDVMIWVRTDASPWRMKQIRAAIDGVAHRLGANGQNDGRRND